MGRLLITGWCCICVYIYIYIYIYIIHVYMVWLWGGGETEREGTFKLCIQTAYKHGASPLLAQLTKEYVWVMDRVVNYVMN
jgi:hypothetical protein